MAPNRRKNRNRILATASLFVIVVACIAAAGCTGGTSTPGAADGLAGTSWSLDSYVDENGTLIGILPGTEITARFDDSMVTGSAGCNGYGSDYQLDGTTLSVSSIAQTLKLCLEPEGIMEQEARFIDLLGSAAECRIENDRLIITDAEGTDVLVFVKEAAPTGLAGTSWTLASLAGENGTRTPVLDGTVVTAIFSVEGNVGGSAGCNSYGAGYTTDGASLTIEPAIRTEMYCSEPPGVMDQEDRYLALLTEVASYRMEDDLLFLIDSEGTDLLVFEKAAQMPDLPLVGTDWVLESYSTNGDTVSSVIAGTKITATFAPDGKVTGNAGCNHYGGDYDLDGASISISSLYSTLMYCETPGVMEQEAQYMALLTNVSFYRTEGDRLILTDAEGTDLLFFVQAPEVPPAPLAGTAWTLESYSLDGETVSSVIVGTAITAVFDHGNVTGSAGCNTYGAGYVLDGKSLTIEPPISTKMHCNEPAGVMEQENRYLNLLESVAGYHIDGNRLDLRDEAGKTLLSYSAGRP